MLAKGIRNGGIAGSSSVSGWTDPALVQESAASAISDNLNLGCRFKFFENVAKKRKSAFFKKIGIFARKKYDFCQKKMKNLYSEV